jgi:4-amino-4-deoxy-L-arabinose transferase-like glycosyltransferase
MLDGIFCFFRSDFITPLSSFSPLCIIISPSGGTAWCIVSFAPFAATTYRPDTLVLGQKNFLLMFKQHIRFFSFTSRLLEETKSVSLMRTSTQGSDHLGLPVFLLLVAAYLIPGLIGHDPWKQDETYIFGIVHHMMQSGDLIVPTMAGEPFVEKPPLYYWLAAALAWITSPWLPPHDGARLASGIFMAITCGCVAWAARHWWGRGHGRYAALSLLACLGMTWYSHLMLTDLPVLAGFAIASCGFALSRTKRFAGGIVLSVGIGTGFLGKGLLAPGTLGVTAVLLPLLFREWRSKTYFQAMGIAFIASLPWLLIWPIALYRRSPELFMDWFWLNNVGRFLGFSVQQLGAPHTKYYWLTTLPWLFIPALPLALVGLWRQRAAIPTQPGLQYALVVFGTFMVTLAAAASARPSYALPLLVPTALVAAPTAVTLPAWIDRTFDWSARLLFGACAIAIWRIWLDLVDDSHGHVNLIFAQRHLPLTFTPHLGFVALVIAPIMTIAAIILIWREGKRPGRGLVNWTIGLALAWGLISTLWLDWVDYAKSYRSVYISMLQVLPTNRTCLASVNLAESERAMLDYMFGIVTRRRETDPRYTECNVLLVEDTTKRNTPDIDRKKWKLFWEGSRPDDDHERFWLFMANP